MLWLTIQRHFSGLAEGILAGNRTSLARGITLMESRLPEHSKEAQELLKTLTKQKGNIPISLRIGVTGSPGVGKSSLIERLGMYCIEREGLKVATLAIDPSSQKSGGSILGDKTRMSQLAKDSRAFVRPSPSGGQLGGVSRGTFMSIKLCELAGYDVVFVESVGVGQSETELADLTDIFVLCAAPRSGDDLQAMKRGISEMAELILLNKAEESLGAEVKKALMELKSSQTLRSHPAQVIPISALEGTGMKEAWDAIKQLQSDRMASGAFAMKRREQQGKWIKSFIKADLFDRFDMYLKQNDHVLRSLAEEASLDTLKISNDMIKSFCENITN